MLGGGNDRLYGVLCQRLGKPEWVSDKRFITNADRVKNRETLEEMIEGVTRTKTTKEWLNVLEGSGMPYAAINDIKGTLENEHGMLSAMQNFLTYLTLNSYRPWYGDRSRPPVLRTNEAPQPARQVL